MKKYVAFLLTAVMCMLFTCGFDRCEAAKKVVAVTGVENSVGGSYGRKAAQDLDSELVSILVQSGRYDVVERAQLDRVVKELGLMQTGLISGSTAIEFGNLTGAAYTVIGNVVAADVASFNNYVYKGYKAKVKFNFKFIDNKSGVIKVSEVIEGADTVSEFENKNPDRDMMLSNAAKDVARKVLAKINEINPVTGSVVSVKGKTAYIDLGKESGVRNGESYIIFSEGQALVHPVTGEILGVEEEIVGSMKITEVKPNYAVGEIKKQSGKIAAGCKVKRGK